MGYMTFNQQIAQHIQFLQKEGHEITNLMIDTPDFIRSRANHESGRGEYAYKTVSRMLNNGMRGLLTWSRGESGCINMYKTYGYTTDNINENNVSIVTTTCQSSGKSQEALDMENIQKFWELSSRYGESDYLKRKGVGSYRIRFRENRYGKVAIIPITNIRSKLCGYQILNSNGSKVFARGMQLPGAFHQLTKLTDGEAIGIAESYVTAATCLELVHMPMVTALSSYNLEHVTAALQERYPNSPVVIFADNDMHISENKGMTCAFKALARAKSGGVILAPQFENYIQGRNYSDWNDLLRERGRVNVLEQIREGLLQTQDDRIKRFYISVSELLNF